MPLCWKCHALAHILGLHVSYQKKVLILRTCLSKQCSLDTIFNELENLNSLSNNTKLAEQPIDKAQNFFYLVNIFHARLLAQLVARQIG